MFTALPPAVQLLREQQEQEQLSRLAPMSQRDRLLLLGALLLLLLLEGVIS